MFKLILITVMSISLFAYDISKAKDPEQCVGFKEQQSRYLVKAKENKKMSSRYIIIANQYKSMFDECKKDFYTPKLMMKAKPVTISPKVFQKANSYRVNPYNQF